MEVVEALYIGGGSSLRCRVSGGDAPEAHLLLRVDVPLRD
jgi:hypothetical protein